MLPFPMLALTSTLLIARANTRQFQEKRLKLFSPSAANALSRKTRV
jgi:hypothetical protein